MNGHFSSLSFIEKDSWKWLFFIELVKVNVEERQDTDHEEHKIYGNITIIIFIW